MKKTFQIPAQMCGAIPKVDKSMSLRFVTQEISNDERAILMDYLGEAGYLLFKSNSFKESEIPSDDAPTDEQKTPAQRLRGVIYRVWELTPVDRRPEFEGYYRRQVEAIIDQYKSKLN
jgi:hypothetical protein